LAMTMFTCSSYLNLLDARYIWKRNVVK
jgi:hypothetical protein